MTWPKRRHAPSRTSSASASSSGRPSRGAGASPNSVRGEGGGQPEATIIASGAKTLSSRAALANGTMALGFEYADFAAGSRAYPFAVTGPLALAESRHKLGQGPRPGHRHRLRGACGGSRARHPHRPARASTCPPSTARSDRPREAPGCWASTAHHTNYALGLAAAFTGGTFQGHEEGAWQRSLNGGMASERGVTAALLAETGFRATELGPGGRAGIRHHVLRRAARRRRRCSTASGRHSSSPTDGSRATR